MEKKAHECYEQGLLRYAHHREQFVEMMLLDGFFIIQLFRRSSMPKLLAEDSFHFNQATHDILVRDLLILPNRLPFFVLQELFDMTKMEDEQPNHFIELALNFLSRHVMQGYNEISNKMLLVSRNHQGANGVIKHLLDLLYKCWRPSAAEDHPNKKNKKVKETDAMEIELEPLPCATKLEAMGIRLKKLQDKHTSLFDIKFKDAVLWIPKLSLNPLGEKILLNLLAYEQGLYDDLDPKYVTDYVRFMAILINTEKDLELLRSCGTMDYGHGEDKFVTEMFSRLANSVLFSPGSFFYSYIFIPM